MKDYSLVFSVKEIFRHFITIRNYLSTTILTTMSIAIGTIKFIESAQRAGDFYPTREATFTDGVGTLSLV